MGSEHRQRRPARRDTAASVPADVIRGPVRTCVGCRSASAQTAVVRVVGQDWASGPGNSPWQVVPDPARRAPGRGAYVHPDQACVDQATRRRAFGRALRRSGSPDVTDVVAYVDAQQQ